MQVSYPNPNTISVNGRSLEFPQSIEDTVELADRVLVLLNVSDFDDDDPLVGQNVVAIGAEGQVLWRIEPTGGKRRNRHGDMVPVAYFNLWKDTETGQVHVAIPDVILELNPEDGTVANGRYVR